MNGIRGQIVCLLSLLLCGAAPMCVIGQAPAPASRNNSTPITPRAKVVIVRGAFTVFSLGLDALGEKLRTQGMEVVVTPAITANSVTEKLAREYLASPVKSPIIFIGHSRGGQLGPECARQLRRFGVPVKLIVVVDNNHRTTVPDNVQKCVNYYQTNYLGIFRGLPIRGESPKTEIQNININDLSDRGQGGFITHLNIDESTWLHNKIITEVVRAAPAHTPPAIASRTVQTAAVKTAPRASHTVLAPSLSIPSEMTAMPKPPSPPIPLTLPARSATVSSDASSTQRTPNSASVKVSELWGYGSLRRDKIKLRR